MKLNLRHEDSVSVLEVSGPVDLHSFQVLKAGISKLLRDGKNRIVLEFRDTDDLDGEVIREIAIIDVFARELSGKIVLVSGSEELKESVRIFAQPPVIPILSSLELALDYFRKAEPEPEAEEGDSAEMREELAAKQRQIDALEARLKLLDPAVVQELRATNAELSTKVSLLEEQLDGLLKERRQPVEAEGFLEKIEAMEATIKQLSASGGQ